jgi:toxin CptA
MHAGALAVIPPLGLPLWAALAISLAVVLSLVHTLNTHALLRSDVAIVQIAVDADDQWSLLTLRGDNLRARLSPATYLHPRLVILTFRLDRGWKTRSVVVLPDSVDPTTFRRLRLRLTVRK